MTLVTVILKNYDIELEDKPKGIPPFYMIKPTLGVMDPAGDGDIVVKIRQFNTFEARFIVMTDDPMNSGWEVCDNNYQIAT